MAVASPKFVGGDSVIINRVSLTSAGTRGSYTVIRSYPVEHMDPVYRIRSNETGIERMVPGTEIRLAPVLVPTAAQADAQSGFGRFS